MALESSRRVSSRPWFKKKCCISRPLLDRHVDLTLIPTIDACDASCPFSSLSVRPCLPPCKAPTSSHVSDTSRGCFRAVLEGDGGKRDTRPRSQALPSPEQAVHEHLQSQSRSLKSAYDTRTPSPQSSTSPSCTLDYPASRSPAQRAVLRRTAAPIVRKPTLQQVSRGHPHLHPARLPLGSPAGLVPVISTRHHYERLPHVQSRPTCLSSPQVASRESTGESARESAAPSKRCEDCTGRGAAAVNSVPGTPKYIPTQRDPKAP